MTAVSRNIVFVGAHLGYPMDRTPLGGGGMVGAQLLRHWAARPAGWPDFSLIALGSGPEVREPGVDYHRLPEGPFTGRDEGLIALSELQYARFCRQFERATTDWILSRRAALPPGETAILVNDISEGPDLARLAAAGYPVASIWHVDVVDYFAKMYFKGALSARSAARGYERLRRMGLAGLTPDLLKLVFEKQRETARWSGALILPSSGMARTVEACYGAETRSRCRVLPWGAWRADVDEAEVARRAERARRDFGLRPEAITLLTVSRISPEKGLHLLLQALERLETSRGEALPEIRLLMCGEPAFMQGQAYWRRVRRAAARLRRVRVHFPGYQDAAGKRALMRLSSLFVSPSVHESYGLSIAEALQAGLPVLASDHYGVRELLSPEYARVVSYEGPGGAPAALAGALEELVAEPRTLEAMAAKAAEAGARLSFESAARRVFETALAPLEGAALPGGRP